MKAARSASASCAGRVHLPSQSSRPSKNHAGWQPSLSAICCSRLAPTRFVPFSYFWICWNVSPICVAQGFLAHAEHLAAHSNTIADKLVGRPRLLVSTRFFGHTGLASLGIPVQRFIRYNVCSARGFCNYVWRFCLTSYCGLDQAQVKARDLTAQIAQDSGHFVADEIPDFFCDQLEQFLGA
jgi:hypothetical protein